MKKRRSSIKGKVYFPSRFICIWCGKENLVGSGIQRQQIKEKYHIKNLFCINCNRKTPNVEVRNCDMYDEILEKVPELLEQHPIRETILK